MANMIIEEEVFVDDTPVVIDSNPVIRDYVALFADSGWCDANTEGDGLIVGDKEVQFVPFDGEVAVFQNGESLYSWDTEKVPAEQVVTDLKDVLLNAFDIDILEQVYPE